jgi:hypothetical protein
VQTILAAISRVWYIFTVGIGSGFAYVAAYFFDIATQLSLSGPAYALTFISTGWTTARDLANMAFLFILLYIAFQILLSAETSGTMPLLAGVIAVALLVNFSFVFTRLVIDAGNIVSIEFYNSIQAPSLQTSATASGVQAAVSSGVQTITGSSDTKDLTANIMGMLQLQNLFGTKSFQAFFGDGTKPSAGFMVTAIALTFLYVAAGIMFWLLSVMFITTGVKFLMRIVVLWFLIIFSPLAFVAWAMPQFKGYFTKWRSLLIAHAFYPVAFMFIFLMLTNFANQMSCTANGQVVANCTGLINDVFNGLSATSNSSSAVAAIGYAVANVAIRLGFVIAILYLGMQAAQTVSVMGASTATKAGNWFGGTYAGWMKGGANFARSAATRPAGALYAQSVGRGATRISNDLKASSFGNTRIGSYLRKNVLVPVADSKVGGARSFTESSKAKGDRSKESNNNLRDVDNKAKIKEAPELEGLLKPLEKIEKDFKEFTQLQAKALAATAPGGIALTADEAAALARHTAAGTTGLTADEIAKKDLLTNKLEESKSRIKNLNKRELDSMSAGDIKAVAHIMTEAQIKNVKESDSSKLNEKEKDEINTKWHEESSSASLQKANKEIDELRKIEDILRSSGVSLATVSSTIGTKFSPIVGATIDAGKIASMKGDINTQISTVETALRSPGGNTVAGRQNLRNLQEGLRHLDKMDEERGKVPANVGGEIASGKFKTK